MKSLPSQGFIFSSQCACFNLLREQKLRPLEAQILHLIVNQFTMFGKGLKVKEKRGID